MIVTNTNSRFRFELIFTKLIKQAQLSWQFFIFFLITFSCICAFFFFINCIIMIGIQFVSMRRWQHCDSNQISSALQYFCGPSCDRDTNRCVRQAAAKKNFLKKDDTNVICFDGCMATDHNYNCLVFGQLQSVFAAMIVFFFLSQYFLTRHTFAPPRLSLCTNFNICKTVKSNKQEDSCIWPVIDVWLFSTDALE